MTPSLRNLPSPNSSSTESTRDKSGKRAKAPSMQAWAIVENGKPLQCIEVSTPTVAGTEVLVKVSNCGVCHSDLHLWEGYYDLGGGKRLSLKDRGVVLPRAPGHEIAGTVAAIGNAVTGVKVGDVRVVYPWIGCGDCLRCQAGEDNLCSAQRSLGVLQDGGFAAFVKVPHPRYLFDIDGLDPALASTFACSGLTTYSAARKIMPLAPSKPVLVIGAGGLGFAGLSVLRAMGHQNILVADLNKEKREAALAAGASFAFDPAAPGARETATQAAGGPIAAVLDFVNNAQTAQLGIDLLEKGGTMVQVGVGGGELPVSLAGLIFRGISILGNNTGTLQDLRDVIALARQGKLPPIPIVRTARSNVNKAMADLNEGRVIGRIVLVDDL